jgi:hypothetical protein
MTETIARLIGEARRKPLPVGAALLSVALTGLLPAGAVARTFQGSISPPTVSADGHTVTAQIAVSAQCSGSEYCGFFPEVTTVPDSQPCASVITGSTWVGSLVDTSTTAIATWSEWPTLYSGGKRACLYAMSEGVLVAEALYQVPAPPPPPTYAPPPVYSPPTSATPVSYGAAQKLGYSEAVGVMRSWMSRTYGRRWRNGHRRVVRCPVRSSAAQIGCYAVWIYGSRVYSKTRVITERPTTYTISPDFYSAPAQSSTPTSTAFCATHVCIPNYPYGTGSIVRCADGTYSHSGGRQGACSWHGGVARAASARNNPGTAAALAPAQRLLAVSRRHGRLTVITRLRR